MLKFSLKPEETPETEKPTEPVKEIEVWLKINSEENPVLMARDKNEPTKKAAICVLCKGTHNLMLTNYRPVLQRLGFKTTSNGEIETW